MARVAEQERQRQIWEDQERRIAEQRAAEQRLAEQRAAERRAAEQRAAEQRMAEQQMAEQRMAEQRMAEQRMAEQRAAERRAAEALQVAEEQRRLAEQERRRAEEREVELRMMEMRIKELEQGRQKDRSQGSARTAIGTAVRSKLLVEPNQVSYTKQSVLGQGSFGTVYRGMLRGSTKVAIKTIKGDVTPRLVKMFEDEIATWEGLNQRNVLPLLAYCSQPPMMISELASDGNMRDYLEDNDWDQKAGVKCLRGVADGMAYLHSFSVLHGDLKCANIMIDHGIPKIADFGLARIRSALTTSKTRREDEGGRAAGGTPVFMAPELWTGSRLRPPADVYAFAMVCYEVTSEGYYPFMGLSEAMLMEAVGRGSRPERPDDVEEWLWILMQRAWAQDPKARPTFVEIGGEMDWNM
ncbi:kinase-like domain-containing protein [Hyaloraphidium curvatum]|nr:kinase-like domain-containing protein [Hyaloraphidium curvatum]